MPLSAKAAAVVAHLAAGAVADLGKYFDFLPGPCPVQTVRIDVAIPVVGNLIRTSASHLPQELQQLLRRHSRALAKNVKNTLENKDVHIAELQAELRLCNGSCPKPRPMKRFPYGNDIIISPIDRNSHGYQEGWPLSARTVFSEGVAARAI